jgi:cation transporter-like permease
LFIVGYIIVKNYTETYLVKTVKEFVLTLIAVAFIVNITGTILQKMSVVIRSLPQIYLIYPALIDTIGSVGSIVGSTATTKLALGIIKSSFFSIKHHLAEIGSAWISSLIMFLLYGVIASSLYDTWFLSDFFRFIVQLLITNLLAVTLIVLVSFGVAISTKKRGLDPDNFVIPIESALADSITTTSLLIILMMI